MELGGIGELLRVVFDDVDDHRRAAVSQRLLLGSGQLAEFHVGGGDAGQPHRDVADRLQLVEHRGRDHDVQRLSGQSGDDDRDQHGTDRLHDRGRGALQSLRGRRRIDARPDRQRLVLVHDQRRGRGNGVVHRPLQLARCRGRGRVHLALPRRPLVPHRADRRQQRTLAPDRHRTRRLPHLRRPRHQRQHDRGLPTRRVQRHHEPDARIPQRHLSLRAADRRDGQTVVAQLLQRHGLTVATRTRCNPHLRARRAEPQPASGGPSAPLRPGNR